MHVVITGASSGIGEALVREFVAAGAKVTMVARRRELLEKIAAEVKGETFIQTADLTDPSGACDFVAPAEAALGPIDVLINNAGAQIVKAFDEVRPDEGEAQLRLNLFTPLRLMDRVLPSMLQRNKGTIVNVASVAAFNNTPGMVHYCASKAGLGAASETLRAELRNTGVNVLTIYPGPVKTAMADAGYERYPDNLAMRLLPEGTAATMARRIRRAVERGSERIVYPRFYYLSRWFEYLVRFFMDRSAPMPKRAALPLAAGK